MDKIGWAWEDYKEDIKRIQKKYYLIMDLKLL